MFSPVKPFRCHLAAMPPGWGLGFRRSAFIACSKNSRMQAAPAMRARSGASAPWTLTTILAILVLVASPGHATACDFSVESIESLPSRFPLCQGWAGGDAAYSVRVSDNQLLWLFGDTFLGTISDGKRDKLSMVHNSAALETLTSGETRYFVGSGKSRNIDLLVASQPGTWYWPGAGLRLDDKLVLFVKRVAAESNGTPGFEFKWIGDSFLVIENPCNTPDNWRYKAVDLNGTSERSHLGTALWQAGDYIYIFGIAGGGAILARAPSSDIKAGCASSLRYYAGEDRSGARWSSNPSEAKTLFDHAAPEMSVSQMPGGNLLAIFSRDGLGRDIMASCARTPVGPWSPPMLLHRVRKFGEPRLFCYGAKAHPDLSPSPHQLFITYCVNSSKFCDHKNRADIYLPRMIKVTLRPASQQSGGSK